MTRTPRSCCQFRNSINFACGPKYFDLFLNPNSQEPPKHKPRPKLLNMFRARSVLPVLSRTLPSIAPSTAAVARHLLRPTFNFQPAAASNFGTSASLFKVAERHISPKFERGDVVTYSELKPITKNPTDVSLLGSFGELGFSLSVIQRKANLIRVVLLGYSIDWWVPLGPFCFLLRKLRP